MIRRMSVGLGSGAPEPATDGQLSAGAVREWLDTAGETLAQHLELRCVALEDEVDRHRHLMRQLYSSGLSRHGWPTSAGGFGGDERSRAVLYDELARAGITLPEAFVLLETLGPVLVRFAPHLAARHLPPYLRGDELWGQGFSEPDAGSDLASVRTRAIPDGPDFRLNGSKIWTTLGQCAQWAMVLCRTEPSGNAQSSLSMLWVDLRAEGVDVRPIRASNGRNEFAEMSFTDVRVPADGLIGERGTGWAIAMYLLQFERGMYAWGRQAELHRVLNRGLQTSRDLTPVALSAIGTAFGTLTALRSRSANTVTRLARGEALGPEASIDKILLSRAEQQTHDALAIMHHDDFVFGDDVSSGTLRDSWFYSRATSIFGGAVEIQRSIVAERLLKLPREVRHGG